MFGNSLNSLADALDTWAIRSSGTTNHLGAVAYGNGSFVTVGELGTILTSPDGMVWSSQNTGTNNFLVGLAYGNGTFVAVGEDTEVSSNAVILASVNGTNWTSRTASTAGYLTSVTFANGMFVAVGAGGSIVTSTDGETWTSRPSGTNSQLNEITYGNGGFLAVGSENTVASSPDGVSWTSRGTGVTSFLDPFGVPRNFVGHLGGVAYGNGRFTAVGLKSFNNQFFGLILTSPDGVTWTAQDYPGDTFIPYLRRPMPQSVTYGNGIFLVAGGGGLLLSSTNGTAWSRHDAGIPFPVMEHVMYAQSTFVAVGDGGVILQSGSFAPAQLAVRNVPTNGGFELSITGEIARSYRVQATTNLTVTNWVELFAFTNFQTATTNFVDSQAGQFPQRFYRVISP